MNDPHVAALHYRINHADTTDYDNAPTLEHQEAEFSIRIEKGKATTTMKGYYATSEAARALVEPFLRAWELSAALVDASDNFEFVFEASEIVDREPASGVIGAGGAGMAGQSTLSAYARTKRGKYPDPPVRLTCDADVDLIFECYRRYCAGHRSLSDACYFCLTVLERAAGSRRDAAAHFGIDFSVLTKIGELTAQKGGREARKISGAGVDFTSAERTWLHQAMKMLARRAAEVAYDPTANQNYIGIGHLPPI